MRVDNRANFHERSQSKLSSTDKCKNRFRIVGLEFITYTELKLTKTTASCFDLLAQTPRYPKGDFRLFEGGLS